MATAASSRRHDPRPPDVRACPGRFVWPSSSTRLPVLKKARRRFAEFLARRFPRLVEDAFALRYYGVSDAVPPWHQTTWMGRAILKPPSDLWNYHELIFELRPDLIIETGTWSGASAHYLAHQLDLLDHGEICTVDLHPQPDRPGHPRVSYLEGSSTDEQVFEKLQRKAADCPRVMVILDSAHTQAHVAEELRLYSQLVTPGSFLVVEDTSVNGHPVLPDHGPGPMEALTDFLRENDDFVVDRRDSKFMLSFSPHGFLRRVERADES